MNLIIDQGNSRTKIAIYQRGEMLDSATYDHFDTSQFLKWCDKYPVEKGIISSVVGDELFLEMKKIVPFPIVYFNHRSPLPFVLNYSTPETIGIDRLALASAAVGSFPGVNCLVIDAGTCITYDFISSEGVYQGGAISPGLQMKLKALNTFTAKLPLVKLKDKVNLIGKSTADSILSGVVLGTCAEMDGTINAYKMRFPEMKIILTGGDAPLFAGYLKNSIFAAPEFLLTGLNNILEKHA